MIWKGNDYGTGLVNVLSNNETIKDLAKTIGNFQVRTHPNKFKGWTLLPIDQTNMKCRFRTKAIKG